MRFSAYFFMHLVIIPYICYCITLYFILACRFPKMIGWSNHVGCELEDALPSTRQRRNPSVGIHVHFLHFNNLISSFFSTASVQQYASGYSKCPTRWDGDEVHDLSYTTGVRTFQHAERRSTYTRNGVVNSSNPKHMASGYLKSDSQSLWARNAARKHKQAEEIPASEGRSVVMYCRR